MKIERSEAHASRSHNNQSKNTARRFMMEGRHVEKEIKEQEERRRKRALYFLKKPPSWSIMLPPLPLLEGGAP